MSTDAILDTLGNTEIVVTRFGVGRLVAGKLKASKLPPFKIKAAVQPIKGREREFMPEGQRQKHIVKLYCKECLLAPDDKRQQRADLLTIEGEGYEVIIVEKQKGLGLDHYKAYAARRND